MDIRRAAQIARKLDEEEDESDSGGEEDWLDESSSKKSELKPSEVPTFKAAGNETNTNVDTTKKSRTKLPRKSSFQEARALFEPVSHNEVEAIATTGAPLKQLQQERELREKIEREAEERRQVERETSERRKESIRKVREEQGKLRVAQEEVQKKSKGISEFPKEQAGAPNKLRREFDESLRIDSVREEYDEATEIKLKAQRRFEMLHKKNLGLEDYKQSKDELCDSSIGSESKPSENSPSQNGLNESNKLYEPKSTESVCVLELARGDNLSPTEEDNGRNEYMSKQDVNEQEGYKSTNKLPNNSSKQQDEMELYSEMNLRGSQGLYIAEYDFDAQQEDDLTIREGDKLELLEALDENWWKGKSMETGLTGIFPKSYVKEFSMEENERDSRNNAGAQMLYDQNSTINQNFDETSEKKDIGQPGNPTGSPKEVRKAFVELYKAEYDFQAVEPNDLGFVAGEIIELIDKLDEDWYKGRIEEREGLFPASYVSPCLTSDVDNNFKEQDSTVPKYIAAFDYASEEPGDLTFETGEVITVLDKLDESWWRGQIGQREGIFPASFVQKT